MKTRLLSLLLSALLTAVVSHAYNTSYYARSSAFSEGKWVKVAIDTTAVYRIDYRQLREMGFADPSAVKVYGYGGIRATDQTFSDDYPDDICPAAYHHTADGRLLFYGEGVVRGTVTPSGLATFERNHYDTLSYYYLTDSGQHIDVPASSYIASDLHAPLDRHLSIGLVEREVQNPGHGGVFCHGRILSPGDSECFSFRIKDFIGGGSPANGTFRYEAYVKTPTSVRLPIEVSDNINVLSKTPSASGVTTSPTKLYVSASGSASFNASTKKPLDDTKADFTVNLPTSFKGSYAAIDKAYVVYPRANRLGDEASVIMNFKRVAAEQTFTVSDAPAGCLIWDVTDPAAITAFETQYDEATATHTASFTRQSSYSPTRVAVINPDATHREIVAYAPVPCQNLHGTSVPDMLIVTTADKRAAAEQLAAIHLRRQGMDVTVAVQDEIFNEFSSGSRHPSAIRRLAKMFHDRDAGKFRFLLLYGPATWDNRSLEADRSAYVVSFQAELVEKAREAATNYCADQYFGMLDDSFKPSEISFATTSVAIGRLPVMFAADGYRVNRKIDRYLESPNTARDYLQTLMISDNEQNCAHIQHSREATDAMTAANPAFTSTAAAVLLYPVRNGKSDECRNLVLRSLSSGMGYMAYSGHSGEVSVGSEGIYNVSLANSYNYNTLPLATFASCDAFPLDRRQGNLAETMVLKEGGGALGVVAACRSVYLEHNRSLNLAMARAYSSAIEGSSTGEIFAKARNMIVSGTGSAALGDNTLCYNLCGDPALPVGAPSYSVGINTVAGSDAAGTVTAASLETVAISADIRDRAGRTVTGFNGSAVIEIYDAPVTRRLLAEKDSSIVCDEVILATLPATVTAGRIDADITLPATSGSTPYNRIVITAIDSETRLTAAGACLTVSVTPPPADATSPSPSAPVIEELYIDSPSFNNGDTTAPTFTLHAVIDPGTSGLARDNWGVSRRSSLVLDGKKHYPETINAMRFGDSGKMILDKVFDGLSDGRHTLQLTAVSNDGSSTTASVDFVVTGTAEASLSLDGDNPAREIAVITAEGVTSAARLIIRDSRGNTVLSRRDCRFPFRWNLLDSTGRRVADGRYEATALVETETAYGSTEPLEIVVLR